MRKLTWRLEDGSSLLLSEEKSETELDGGYIHEIIVESLLFLGQHVAHGCIIGHFCSQVTWHA